MATLKLISHPSNPLCWGGKYREGQEVDISEMSVKDAFEVERWKDGKMIVSHLSNTGPVPVGVLYLNGEERSEERSNKFKTFWASQV